MKIFWIYWHSVTDGSGMSRVRARNPLAAANSFMRQFKTRCVLDVVPE